MGIVIQEVEEIIVEEGDTSITIQTVPDAAIEGDLTISHSMLTDLSADDHTQYWLRTDTLYSNSDIKTSYEANSNTNVFTDADRVKLDGISAGASATPSANTIKSLYLSNLDTNNYDDDAQTAVYGLTNTITVTADGAVDVTNLAVFIDATSNDITLTLPTAAGITGISINLKRVDVTVNTVLIETTSTETIDSSTGAILATNQNLLLVSDGTNWRIL
mgnify:FL=1|jgi:hypothetical protein